MTNKTLDITEIQKILPLFSEAQNEARLSFNDDRMYLRIQVEHTVTEMVTGIDLVKAQVIVAANEPLPFTQQDIQVHGNAIECRINAENPKQNFMPVIGTINYLYLPVGNLGMRIDTAIYPGSKITSYYDSMIAKVIALGQDRQEAIEKIKLLLNEMVIMGVTTNQNFHLAILNNPKFLAGTASTTFLEDFFLPQWKKELTA